MKKSHQSRPLIETVDYKNPARISSNSDFTDDDDAETHAGTINNERMSLFAEGFEGNGAPMILSPKGKFTISPRNKTKSGGLGSSQ